MLLSGKKIILAVTGSIAAYKTPQLTRLLVKAGAQVRVLMTRAAADFVSPLSLATVSKHAVLSDVSDGATWNNHVELGLWADLMLVAPCSANTLAKMAHGICDNLVCAVYLSARCPVFLAPAMDEDMWLHPATRTNISQLRAFGSNIIPVGNGELASGLVGEGRMAEPEDIVNHLAAFLNNPMPLAGYKALVTAGPTYERIDPVRFIGNFSTGKMGFAIAESLAASGAEVTLVAGPTHEQAHHSRINTIRIESARELFIECMRAFEDADIAVMAAAVADYRPEQVAAEKIKKAGDQMFVALEKTEDTLSALGKIKRPDQTLVGFALETNDEVAHATQKLIAKNADMIVLNSLRDTGAGFGHDTNKVTLLTVGGEPMGLPLQSKKETADAIVGHILKLRHVQKTA